MNTGRSSDVDHRALQILDELSNNDSLTQRDLSSRLGIALGLVNTYIKNLVKKGYITVRAIPPKRYTYYLTPKGFTEKTRLTYHLLQDYTRIYREARSSVMKLFHGMERAGMKKIVFAGADEVAEIAYITLQETEMGLVGVVDEERAGNAFFGKKVQPIRAIQTIQHDCIVVTSYLNEEKIYKQLLDTGIDKDSIRRLFASSIDR